MEIYIVFSFETIVTSTIFYDIQGQTVFDVADSDVLKVLEELKIKQQVMMKDQSQIVDKKQTIIPKKRLEIIESMRNLIRFFFLHGSILMNI